MDKYRVFISYSHTDYKIAKKLVKILEENGLIPIWDKNLKWGHGFPEQIKNFIAHAHVFIPLITKSASKRGWVHQEIGYAMALNVPILPITLDRVPEGMLQNLHAVAWSSNLKALKQKLSYETFDNLVKFAQENFPPLFECAEFHEARTKMLIDYAKKVRELGFFGHIRQKGLLSSFHIPNKPLSDPIWRQRYGTTIPSEYRCQLLLEERRIFEEHARESGCSLIVDPYYVYNEKEYGISGRLARLKPLLEFLESMPDDKIKIAFYKGIPKQQNLIIVGDWFVAESISASFSSGFRQTIFTRHAPTIQRKIETFDQELHNLLKNQKIPPQLSRKFAIQKIEQLIKKLEGSLRQI